MVNFVDAVKSVSINGRRRKLTGTKLLHVSSDVPNSSADTLSTFTQLTLLSWLSFPLGFYLDVSAVFHGEVLSLW